MNYYHSEHPYLNHHSHIDTLYLFPHSSYLLLLHHIHQKQFLNQYTNTPSASNTVSGGLKSWLKNSLENSNPGINFDQLIQNIISPNTVFDFLENLSYIIEPFKALIK